MEELNNCLIALKIHLNEEWCSFCDSLYFIAYIFCYMNFKRNKPNLQAKKTTSPNDAIIVLSIFRQAITSKRNVKNCKNSNDKDSRNTCEACWLSKCLEIGLKSEFPFHRIWRKNKMSDWCRVPTSIAFILGTFFP